MNRVDTTVQVCAATSGGDVTGLRVYSKRGGNITIGVDEIDSLVSALYSLRSGQHSKGDSRVVVSKPADNVVTLGGYQTGRMMMAGDNLQQVPKDNGRIREIPDVKSNTSRIGGDTAIKPGEADKVVVDVPQPPSSAVVNTGDGTIAALAPKPKRKRKLA